MQFDNWVLITRTLIYLHVQYIFYYLRDVPQFNHRASGKKKKSRKNRPSLRKSNKMTTTRYLHALPSILLRLFLNRPVREDVHETVQFEDHLKMRFPRSAILSFKSTCVFWSAATVNITVIHNLCWMKYSRTGKRKPCRAWVTQLRMFLELDG